MNIPPLDKTWTYFEWTTERLPPLLEKLKIEIDTQSEHVHKLLDEMGSYDGDDRAITNRWINKYKYLIEIWCTTLEISIGLIPEYKIKRAGPQSWNVNNWPSSEVVKSMFSILAENSGGPIDIFRPACLNSANNHLMDWLKRHPQDIDRVHHRTFEAIISEIIAERGWRVDLTKQTRDGGYDIIAIRNDSLGFPLTMIIETKLYNINRAVGLSMIDRLMGVGSRLKIDKKILVTNSRFSSVVWKEWEHRVGRDLSLIDRSELLEWLKSYRGLSID